jgi:hypothetical protein
MLGIQEIPDQLNEEMGPSGGRVYLVKDIRHSEEEFLIGYTQVQLI